MTLGLVRAVVVAALVMPAGCKGKGRPDCSEQAGELARWAQALIDEGPSASPKLAPAPAQAAVQSMGAPPDVYVTAEAISYMGNRLARTVEIANARKLSALQEQIRERSNQLEVQRVYAEADVPWAAVSAVLEALRMADVGRALIGFRKPRSVQAPPASAGTSASRVPWDGVWRGACYGVGQELMNRRATAHLVKGLNECGCKVDLGAARLAMWQEYNRNPAPHEAAVVMEVRLASRSDGGKHFEADPKASWQEVSPKLAEASQLPQPLYFGKSADGD